MSTPETINRWLTYLSNVDCTHLGLREWAEITGIGARPRYGQYEVRLLGVYPRGYTDVEIESANTEQQIFMLQINIHHPLAFPFTLQRLLEFADGPDGNIGGLHFELPEGFREAATILLNPIYIPGTVSARSVTSDQPIVQVSPEEAAAILAEPIQAHPIDDLCNASPPLKINERSVGEPFLRLGPNPRAAVEKWVKWHALRMAEDFPKVTDIAENIRLLAERHGYRSERKGLTVASITKMIPAGLTGGRGKNKGKPTSRPSLIYGKGERKGKDKPGV
jgi:hypothetical protein